MAIGGKIKIRGGQRLARYIAELTRSREQLKGTKAEVGFFGPQIATLAATHEFGSRPKDGTKVPARPAFGRARPEMRQGFRQALRQQVEGKRGLITPQALEVAAVRALEVVRESYRSAPGPELSERQQARKRGTPGEGRKLVGHRGERLIQHLQARVERRRVR